MKPERMMIYGLLGFAVLTVVFGSFQARQRAEIAALQQRVEMVEAKWGRLRTNLLDVLTRSMASQERAVIEWRSQVSESEEKSQLRWREFTRELLDSRSKQIEAFPELVRAEIDQELKRRVAAARPGQPAPARPAVRPAEGFKDGVPLSVWNQIAASAAAEWPGNFSMQSYEVNHQVEAWQKLNR